MEPLRPAPAQSELLGTLPRTEKTPLDLSIAKAQKGPWVFEVKYFKYTLFYPNPAPIQTSYSDRTKQMQG